MKPFAYCTLIFTVLFGSFLSAVQPQLIDIQTVNPKITIDLKYATAENFTGQVIYDFQKCLLLKDVAEALGFVQQELEESGLGLKIWDGYRPMAAQWKFWELIHDERYVSDPRKGGRHTRGTAVDVTLIDQTGRELPMPTPFDDFTEKAGADYMGVSDEAIQNRALLRKIMEKHGFAALQTEWWHFDFLGWQQCPPIDFDMKSIQD
jgi:D-alanyl-D-alanine dipeptidase